MQQHTLDGLHATFREREQRALNAAHHYRQAKQIRAARTATQQPAPPASTASRRRRFVIHIPRPIRMWLLSVLLLTSACTGVLATTDDPVPSPPETELTDPPSGTPLLYQDCFRGKPPQIC